MYRAEGLRAVFGRMGFNDQEIVVLSGKAYMNLVQFIANFESL